MRKMSGIRCAATTLSHSTALETAVGAFGRASSGPLCGEIDASKFNRFRYATSLLMSSPFFMITVNAVSGVAIRSRFCSGSPSTTIRSAMAPAVMTPSGA
jgi:hypothetical protein